MSNIDSCTKFFYMHTKASAINEAALIGLELLFDFIELVQVFYSVINKGQQQFLLVGIAHHLPSYHHAIGMK